MPFERERVLANEQRLVALEAKHHVARAVPVTPRSVWTATIAASQNVRGLVSQLA